MATFTFVPDFVKRLGDAEIDLTTGTGHVFKFMLTNTDPSAQNDKADLTAVTGGSYADVTITHSWALVTGKTYRFAASANPSWTPSGGDFSAARYVVLYSDTHASKALVGFFDNGSSFTQTSGNAFTLDLDANFEIFTLAG